MFFIMYSGSVFSQELIKDVSGDFKFHLEKEVSFDFFNLSEDFYQFNLISGNFNNLDFQLKARMEDELSSEEQYNFFSEVTFFDMLLTYQKGPVGLSLAIINLLGFNSPDFAIEGFYENERGEVKNVQFAHEAEFMMSIVLTYNF